MSAPKFQLSAEAEALLADLKVPVEREAFLRKHAGKAEAEAPRAAEVWDGLAAAGLLREMQATEQPHEFAAAFGGWRAHRGMLFDTDRVTAFQKAIEAAVRPGDRVIDVGAGSGILSLMAARAGAAHVDALEATAIVDQARAVADANGYGDRIAFVPGDAAAFKAEAPADLVVGEWAGMFLFEEWRHYDAFARVRDANLKPGGKVMPLKARVFLSPIDDSLLYMHRGPGYWQRPVWGFDFSLVHEKQWDRTRRIIVQAARQSILNPVEIVSIDCAKSDSRAFFFAHESEHTFAYAATCHGFLGYFDLELAPGVILDSSPFTLDNSWHQSYFPMEQFAIERGDTLVTRVTSTPDPAIGSPVITIRAELRRAGKTVVTQERVYTLEDTQG